jgi:biotin operon repressor
MEQKAIERLEAKSAEEAIINQISRDFNLAPFMARTYFQQMQAYFERYLNRQANIGQMTFLAVSADSPPGQPVAACQRVTISLTLDGPDDLVVLGQGLAELRRSKIERLTHEAREQGALLTQEDLARLLCTSRSTIKRDIAQLRAQGVAVPTRGQVKDIGRGVSHKSQIVGDWLAGYTFSQIQKRRWHTLGSIERYCRDFQRVVQLHHHNLSVANIRQSTGLSERLIGEYLALAEVVGPDNDRLSQLLTTPAEATQQPAELKRGAWLK